MEKSHSSAPADGAGPARLHKAAYIGPRECRHGIASCHRCAHSVAGGYLYHSKKIDLNRLETDYSIPSARLKLRFKEKPVVKNRIFSACKKNSKLFGEPQWKKSLRGKLRLLVKNNIILCEKKFHPRSFTESITHHQIKEFKNKFRNLDNRNKIGIFTNKFPSILNSGNKFYSRYFDNFISPDELLNKNFNKEEIFQIKSDPIYFNFGGNFQNVSFFKKNSLKQTLNEEEKIGQNNIIDFKLKKSLNQTKKKKLENI